MRLAPATTRPINVVPGIPLRPAKLSVRFASARPDSVDGIPAKHSVADLTPGVVQVQTPYGTGTGFFYQPRDLKTPHIVTAAHVVLQIAESEVDHAPRQRFYVTLKDGTRLKVRLAELPNGWLAVDPGSDLAVLEVVGKLPRHLPLLNFRDFRGDPPQRGEAVTLIGRSPGRASFSDADTLATGAIVSDNVMIQTQHDPMNLGNGKAALRLDAPGMGGDSGSPVVDGDGLVVGVYVREGLAIRGEQALTSLFQMGVGPERLIKREKPPKPPLLQRLRQWLKRG